MKYKIGIGGFLNTKKLFLQDFQHFNGNRSTAASEYVNSFQLASYYGNSTTAAFYAIGHLEHHFNGLLTNKIPLFKRLNWTLVGGSNAFYVNRRNNYVEVFAGIENIIKIFRLDVVWAFSNGNTSLAEFRLGTSGLLGNTLRSNAPKRRGGGGISISL